MGRAKVKTAHPVLVVLALFLAACSNVTATAILLPPTQPATPNVIAPTENPTPITPSSTLPPSQTPEPTLEPLPALCMITIDNAGEVVELRTLQIPDFRMSSVSQCSLSFSPDGSLLAGVCDYSTAPVWEVGSGRLRYTLLNEASHEVAIAFNPQGDVLAIGGYSGEIRFFDPSSGKELKTFAKLPSQIWDLSFNPSGDQLAAATLSTGMFITTLPGGELLWSHGEQGHIGVLSTDYSPDGSRIAFGKISSGIIVMDAITGETIADVQIPVPVGDVSYSLDGRWLATGSDDHKIRLWNTADYSLAQTLVGHTNFVNGVVFNPDGSLLISGGHDRKVGIWDVQNGQWLKFLEGHQDAVLRVAINLEGTLIASISWDGTVRLWGVVEK
jgi:WD40 repeat protein